MGGPVGQREAQPGRVKAERSQVSLEGAGLVVAEVPRGVLRREARRVKEGPACQGEAPES